MRLFSYRNRTKFRKLGIALLILAVAAMLIAIFTVAYMERFIVYDRNGAHIDYKWDEVVTQVPVYSEPGFEAEVTYVGDTSHAISEDNAEVSGYYITPEMMTNLSGIRDTLSKGDFNTVLFDMKNGWGTCYYNTSLGEMSSSVDINAVQELIRELKSKGVYLIARIPAFADRNFCLSNVSVGLPLRSGALWVDDDNCYWMDPGNETTISRLESFCIELQALGFREVVLDNYKFPTSEYIVYDQTERTTHMVLGDTINRLQSDMNALGMLVSITLEAGMPFPGESVTGRLYFRMNSGANVASVAEAYSTVVESVNEQLVFLTESHDTRFSEYGVLIPAVDDISTIS